MLGPTMARRALLRAAPARRALVAVAVAVVVTLPLQGVRTDAAADSFNSDSLEMAGARDALPVQDPDRPRAERFALAEAGVSITPPAGWVRSPLSALNPLSDPPDAMQEVARFQ